MLHRATTSANRIGDHIWWIGSNARFQGHYPDWKQVYDVPMILPGDLRGQRRRALAPRDRRGQAQRPRRAVDAVDYEGARRPGSSPPPAPAGRSRVIGARRARRDDRRAGRGARRPAQRVSTWSRPTASRCAGRSTCCYGADLPDRVYGAGADAAGAAAPAPRRALPVYLYGTTPTTLALLRESCARRLPALKIAGMEPSSSGPAQPGEPERDRRADPGLRRAIVLVGLGCPRQEIFVYGDARPARHAVLAVGAAFDYHAGRAPRAAGVDAAARPGVAVAARCSSRAACGGATCCSTRRTCRCWQSSG